MHRQLNSQCITFSLMRFYPARFCLRQATSASPSIPWQNEALEVVVHLLCKKLCTISVGGRGKSILLQVVIYSKDGGGQNAHQEGKASVLRFEDLCIIKILTAHVTLSVAAEMPPPPHCK